MIGAVAVALLVAVVLAAIALRSGGDEPASTATPTATAPATEGTTRSPTPGDTAAGDATGGTATGTGGDDAGADAGTGGDDAGADADAGAGAGSGYGGAPAVDDEQAAAAVCSLAGPELAELTRIAGSGATVESLRDGIGVLDSRLQDLSAAAQGRPELDEVVDVGQELEDAWRDAVAADDAGDGGARAAALGRAAALQARVGALASGAAACG